MSQRRDLSLMPVIQGWDYDPGQVTVRTIAGDDGSIKVQMRLDLGLLQMELDGRPDGLRPHRCESLLAWHRGRVKDYQARNGTDLGFELSPQECEALREESLQYYYRYLSLFVLEDYARVQRDTRRNLDLLDLCHRYGAERSDRRALEQYRPYVIMMNTRAWAGMALKSDDAAAAAAAIKRGLRQIRRSLRQSGRAGAFTKSPEAKILRGLLREIQDAHGIDPARSLRRQLRTAIRQENYELAAELRDRLAGLDEAPARSRAAGSGR